MTALRVRWWLCLIGLLVGGAAAVAVSVTTVPRYTSESALFVSTTDSATAADAFQGGQFSQQRVASYARLLTSDRLLSRVIDQLHLDRSPDDLADDVTAAAAPDTVLLNISAPDPSPELARDIAASMGTQFADMVADLEPPAGAGASPVKVAVIDVPNLPVRPSEPKWVINIAVGLLA